jgi:hypothetical protein
LLIGPGFGTENSTKEFVENLLEGKYSSKKVGQRIGFVHKEAERAAENNSKIAADGLSTRMG